MFGSVAIQILPRTGYWQPGVRDQKRCLGTTNGSAGYIRKKFVNILAMANMVNFDDLPGFIYFVNDSESSCP
jgi:hypothetical protein